MSDAAMTFTEPELDDLTQQLKALVIMDKVRSDNPLARNAAAAITYLRNDRDNAIAEAHDAGAERAIWKEIAERDALGAVVMRDRAANLMLYWAQEADASIDTGHPSGMNVAREVELDTCKEAAETIRALPLPTHAELLAAALELPEIKDLVDAARRVRKARFLSSDEPAAALDALYSAIAALEAKDE